jgi:hypothetical protein
MAFRLDALATRYRTEALAPAAPSVDSPQKHAVEVPAPPSTQDAVCCSQQARQDAQAGETTRGEQAEQSREVHETTQATEGRVVGVVGDLTPSPAGKINLDQTTIAVAANATKGKSWAVPSFHTPLRRRAWRGGPVHHVGRFSAEEAERHWRR